MKAMKTIMTALLSAVALAGSVCAAEKTDAGRPIVAIVDYLQTNGVVSARRNMVEAILKAGCLPVVLPEMEDAAVDQFLSHCDALMVGGGIDGQDYPRRCAYEERVIALAAKREVPIVGICHGCQVINRYFGGTLAPVPSDRKLVHKNDARFERSGERAEHLAKVLPGASLMTAVFGEGTVKVNSSHTMRCQKPAPGFLVTAKAEGDDVIEAIEHERLPIFGFQFHPEVYWAKDARFLELLRRALRGLRAP